MPTPFNYDPIADNYDRQVDTAPYNAHYERPAMLALLPPVAGRDVLDAGCGTGWYAEQLLARGARVTGVDASAAMLAHARRRLGDRAPLHHVDLAAGLPFAQATFDAAIMPLVIHYLEDPRPALRAIHRVLRPGAPLLLSTHHPCHEAERLEREGFAVDYFATQPVEEEWDRIGLVRFFRRPLHELFASVSDAGFFIARVVEPKPTEAFRDVKPEVYDRLLRRPEFLILVAHRP